MATDIDTIQKENDEWLQRTWRPAVGVTYIVICVFDFILFPILWSAFFMATKQSILPWEPLTLKAAGTFHLAYGAILGVAAWSRGKEKMAAYNYTYERPPEKEYEEERSSRPRYDPPRRDR